MEFNFPELTTIGALFRFAAALEQASIEALDAAGDKVTDTGHGETLDRMVKKRRRRADELERARKEKLNETVLEPLMNMPNDPYVPKLPDDLGALDEKALIDLALEIERRTISFYSDSIAKAGPVLAEVRRIFTRFQKESTKNERALDQMR